MEGHRDVGIWSQDYHQTDEWPWGCMSIRYSRTALMHIIIAHTTHTQHTHIPLHTHTQHTHTTHTQVVASFTQRAPEGESEQSVPLQEPAQDSSIQSFPRLPEDPIDDAGPSTSDDHMPCEPTSVDTEPGSEHMFHQTVEFYLVLGFVAFNTIYLLSQGDPSTVKQRESCVVS